MKNWRQFVNWFTNVFPRFAPASSVCFEFSLVQWIACVLLSLVRVITLVLVLQHSIENRPLIALKQDENEVSFCCLGNNRSALLR